MPLLDSTCSLCGKPSTDMIQGTSGAICMGCFDLGARIIAESRQPEPEPPPFVPADPTEVAAQLGFGTRSVAIDRDGIPLKNHGMRS